MSYLLPKSTVDVYQPEESAIYTEHTILTETMDFINPVVFEEYLHKNYNIGNPWRDSHNEFNPHFYGTPTSTSPEDEMAQRKLNIENYLIPSFMIPKSGLTTTDKILIIAAVLGLYFFVGYQYVGRR